MKKYILKIVGLTAVATALVTTVACSKESKSKDSKPNKSKIQILQSLLAKLSNFESSKTKSQITTILGDKKTKNTSLDAATLKSMDFTTPPSFLKPGITTTYSLVQDWTDSSTELKINVTLKRTGEDSKSKIIIIKPNVIDFSTERDRFVTQKSDKTKAQINSVLNGKRKDFVLTPNILELISFKVPAGFDTTFKPTYTLEEAWTDSSKKVHVRVILKKGGEESAVKIFQMLPDGEVTLINFDDEIKKWKPLTIQKSMQTIPEINYAFNMADIKKKDDEIDSSVLTNIGFKIPSNLDTTFKTTYFLGRDWNYSSKTVEVKVVLEKNGEKSIISIKMDTSKVNFELKWNEFVTQTSTKTKKQILQTTKDKKLEEITIEDVGYTLPALGPGFNTTYKIKEIPSNSNDSLTIRIEITLQKQREKSTKEITIKALVINFDDELAKFQNIDSQKTKKEIHVALENKDKNNLDANTLENIGYIPPTLDPTFAATYKFKEETSGTTTTFKIEVTLTKQLMIVTKEITITHLVIDFADELNKFQNKVKSSKTKTEITNALNNKDKNDLDATTLKNIGYNLPTNFDSTFAATYKFKEETTGTTTTFKIEVTLTKQLMTTAKEIIIEPHAVNFKDEFVNFNNIDSQKTKKEIHAKLKNKTKVEPLNIATLKGIGYNPPADLGSAFTATYKLKELWTHTSDKVRIKVILQSRGDKASKVITIKPHTVNFKTELDKFFDTSSSKTKTEIFNTFAEKSITEDASSNIITKADIGYSPQALSTGFVVTYKLMKSPTVDSPEFKIRVILKSRGDKDHKEIEIQPHIVNFKPELDKFVVKKSSKTKTEIIDTLAKKSVISNLADIGYTPPNLSTGFVPTYQITKTKLADTDNEHSVTIKVTLTKQLMTDNREITITPHKIDFSDELAKFKNQETYKIESELQEALKDKRKDDLLDATDLRKIGYTPPTLADRFVAKYKLAEPWVVDASTKSSTKVQKVKIQVALEKRGDKSSSVVITISSISETFKKELAKIPEKLKSTKEMNNQEKGIPTDKWEELNNNFVKFTDEELGVKISDTKSAMKMPKFSREIYATYKFESTIPEKQLYSKIKYDLSIQLVKVVEENGIERKIKSEIKNVVFLTKYKYLLNLILEQKDLKSKKTKSDIDTYYEDFIKDSSWAKLIKFTDLKENLLNENFEIPIITEEVEWEVKLIAKSTEWRNSKKRGFAIWLNNKKTKKTISWTGYILLVPKPAV